MTAFTSFSEIPINRYGAIYADPPWSFKSWSDRGTGRSASQHYTTLSFDELAAFPVANLASDRCALFLWVVRSNIPEALRRIDVWGFTFKSTAFVWAGSLPEFEPGAYKPLPERPEPELEASDPSANIEFARKIWLEAKPISGTLAEYYLFASRDSDLDWPGGLRFHPKSRLDGKNVPGMIALGYHLIRS